MSRTLQRKRNAHNLVLRDLRTMAASMGKTSVCKKKKKLVAIQRDFLIRYLTVDDLEHLDDDCPAPFRDSDKFTTGYLDVPWTDLTDDNPQVDDPNKTYLPAKMRKGACEQEIEMQKLGDGVAGVYYETDGEHQKMAVKKPERAWLKWGRR